MSISALLGFTRYYNSLSFEQPHLLSPRWTNTYTRRIIAYTGYAYVARPDGKALLYIDNSGVFTTDTDTVSKLERIPTSGTLTGWRFTEKDSRQVENFDSKGRLTSITTTSGESVTMVYNNGVTENNPNDLRLTSVTDQQGRALTFVYSGAFLTRITDPSGANYDYAYVSGQLDKVTYPGGAFKRYHYNEPAYTANTHLPQALTGITDEKGDRFATFKYQTDGRAISTEHGAGQEIYSVQYGSGSNPNATILTPSGATETRGFATFFGVRKTTSNLEQYGSTSHSRGVTYVAGNGMVDTTTDYSGVVTNHDYNSRNLETQLIEAESKPGSSSPAERRVTVTDWHVNFAVPTERKVYAGSVAPANMKSRKVWVYNARGQVTAQCEIDPANISFVCGNTSPPATVRQTTYAYCDQIDSVCPRIGLLKSVDGPGTGPVNDVTSYSYQMADHAGCALEPSTCQYRKGDIYRITNALGHVTEIIKYDGAGRVLQSKTQNRGSTASGGSSYRVTDFYYHPRGWLTQRIVRGSVPVEDQTTTTEYDYAGQVTRVTQPDGDYLAFTYDVAHRLTDISDATGSTTHFTLDASGNRVQEQIKSGSWVHRSINRVYNTLAQLQTQANASSTPVVDYTYDSNGAVETVKDAIQRETHNSLDGLGRLTQSIANATGMPSEQASTQFVYNARDQLTRVTDPNGLNTDYTYNDLGDLTGLLSPDTGTTTYSYDSAGNRTQQSDNTGAIVTYGYDALNRLTSATFVKSGSTTLQHTYVYDLTSTSIVDCSSSANYALGRLTQFTDPSGSTTFCYDALGNLTKKTQRKGNGSGNSGLTWVTAFEYTPGGRVNKITYQSGTQVRYTHDANGRVEQVFIKPAGSAIETKAVEQTSYYPFGPLSEVVLMTADEGGGDPLAVQGPDQSASIFVGESQGESLEGGASPAQSGGGSCIGGGSPPCPYSCPYGIFCRWSFNWEYDQDYAISRAPGHVFNVDTLGRINSLTNSSGGTFGVGYDDFDRIETVSEPVGDNLLRQFSYDATGNRLSKFNGSITTNYTYYANTHRLRNIGGGTVDRQYDSAGNTTSVNNRAWAYDTRNRLVSISLGGGNGTLRFQYNARGERMRKWTGLPSATQNSSDISRYVYDEAGRLLVMEEKLDGSTMTVTDMVWLDDRPIAMVRGGTIYVIASDHLGTPRAVYDRANVKLVWRWDVDADVFGESAPDQDADDDLIPFVFNLRYPGQLFDSETGTHYNYFRDYEPGTGRYPQSDPIGLAGGISTYGYVGGNPLRYSDPSGLFFDEIAYGVATGASAATGTSVAVAGAGIAIAGGIGVGAGLTFNAGWEYFAGQSVGGSIYDWLNPQSSAGATVRRAPSAPGFPGDAANDPEFGDGDSCPPDCRKWRQALNLMYHAIANAEKIPTFDPRRIEFLKHQFRVQVSMYEKACGPYRAPPSFDDIYQR